MANFELAQKIKGNENLSLEKIKATLIEQLKSSGDCNIAQETTNSFVVEGGFKTASVYNYKATCTIETQNSDARIIVSGENVQKISLGISLLIMFVLGVIFLVKQMALGVLIAVICFIIKGNSIIKDESHNKNQFDSILKYVETRLGAI